MRSLRYNCRELFAIRDVLKAIETTSLFVPLSQSRCSDSLLDVIAKLSNLLESSGDVVHCCESTPLPPMWPGFDFQTRRHVWAEFVGSLL